MKLLTSAFLLGALLGAPVLAAAQAPATNAPARAAYVLGPDDQITILVSDAPTSAANPNALIQTATCGCRSWGACTPPASRSTSSKPN